MLFIQWSIVHNIHTSLSGTFTTILHYYSAMTSSQMKRFVIVASILSTSDAMSLLRGGSNNDERALEALDCTGRRWHFTLAETIKW